MSRRFILVILLLVLLGTTQLAFGQASFPFQIRVQQDSSVFSVPNNSTLNFAVDGIGKTLTVKVTVAYVGSTSVVIPSAPQLLGSADFTLTSIGDIPLQLKPNDQFTFDIRFKPTTSTKAQAQLAIPYVEAAATTTTQPTQGAIVFNLSGTAPEFSVNYALQVDSNVIPLADGGKLLFQPTTINTTTSATVIILNRGSGPGAVNSISVSGEAYQPLGLPLLPGSLAAGSNLSFTIRYSPRKIGSDTGTLKIDLGGRMFTVSIEGSAIGSTFAYEVLQNSQVSPILPNQVLSLADTAVGESTQAILQVRNVGNADGLINVIGVSGAGFSLTDLPFLPLVLAPNDFISFTLNFVPAQPGRATGRLRIGSDTFELVGTGVGVRLLYSYTSGDTANSVLPAGAVLFSPIRVGETTKLQFTVRNGGTASATLTSIGVGDTKGVFRLENLPRLPMALAPEGSVSFSVVFAPAVTGLATAPLLVNAQQFLLTGFGDPPPPMPSYRFTGATGTQQPFTQPAIGLALASPYPLALRGILTMTVDPEAFTSDPAVQFASGGRTVPFTIAANSTDAVFTSGSKEIKLQTGTVAGTIIITPSFVTESGLEMKPGSTESLRLQVPRSAPVLLAVQLAARSANSFTLQVTGYSTTRSLKKLDFQLKGVPDVTISGTQLSVSVEAESAVWYSSSASAAYGGQFTVAIPFTLRSDQSSLVSPVDKIDSVSVTASNELGSSQALAVRIQ